MNEETKGEEEETKVEDEETKGGEEQQTEVATASSICEEVVTDLNGYPLFKMTRSSRVDWEHVRLVAKIGTDMTKVTSQDAIKAFCLLCRMNITFSKGNGNSVYRHNRRKHSERCMNVLQIGNHHQEKQHKGNKKAKVSSGLKQQQVGTPTDKLCRLLRACQFKEAETIIPNMMKSDLNNVDKHGDNAIHIAFSLEQYDIVKLLAMHGASLETRNSVGKTLFQLIAGEHQPMKQQHMLSLSQYLLEHYYVNLKMRDNDDDYPAHIAFQYKNYDLVKLFIEKGGFSANTLDKNKLSILHKALRIKQYDMIELCLEYGANRDLPDDNGYTPNNFIANVKDDQMIQLFNNNNNNKNNNNAS